MLVRKIRTWIRQALGDFDHWIQYLAYLIVQNFNFPHVPGFGVVGNTPRPY
jgi:hypothetical protein